MATKNILFRFNADASQVLKILDELNQKLLDFSKKTNIALKGGGVEKGQLNAAIKLAEAEQKASIRRIAAEEKSARDKEKQERLLSIKEQESQERLAIRRIREERRQATIDAARAAREANRTSSIAAPQGAGFGDILRGGLATFGIVATVDALVDLSKETIRAAINFENLTASFRALIGDKQRADLAIKEIQQFALQTPFDVTQVAAAAKTLLGYGINIEQVIPTLKQLGEVSAASGGDIQRVALAFGQIAAKGKLQGEEIRQLVNIGFNPLQEISRKTGESMAALAKRVEAGKVSFEEVAEAFKVATSEGGRFFGLTAALTETFGGKVQKLAEQFGLLQIELGSIAAGELKPLVEDLLKFTTALTESAKSVKNNTNQLTAFKIALAFVVSLLAKTANAYVLTILRGNSLRKAIVILTAAFQFNTVAIGNNTAAQRRAVIQTIAWDTANSVLRGGITLLSKAVNGLWTIIRNNPIGILIGLYILWNDLKEKNRKITREEFLEQKGLLDLQVEYRKAIEELSAKQKTNQELLKNNFGIVEENIKTLGLQNEKTKQSIKNLQDQYGIQLKIGKAEKDNDFQRKKALQTLEQARLELEKRANAQERVNTAETEIAEINRDIKLQQGLLEGVQDRYNKAAKAEKDLLAERQKGRGTFNIFKTFGTDLEYREQKNIRAKLGNELVLYRNNLDEAEQKLKTWKEELKKASEELLNSKNIFGQFADALADGSDDAKKAVLDLLKYINQLQEELDDLGRKTLEFDISILPTLTEQNQVQKAEALFNFAKSEADRLKKIETDALNERLQAAINAGKKEIELVEIKEKGKQIINERYTQRLLLDERKFNEELKKTREEWREEDLKNLRAYTDQAIEQLRILKEQEAELLGERLQSAATDLENAPIGQGKKYKERLMQQRLDAVENLRQIANAENKQVDINYQREKNAIEEKYNFQETITQKLAKSGVELSKEQMAQLELDNQIEQDMAKFKTNAIELLDTKYEDEKELRRRAQLKRQQGLEEEAQKLEKAASDARINRIFDEVQASVDAAFTIANAAIEAEMMKNDKLIELQQDRVERAREIADKGNAELYEAEQKRLDDLNKQRAKFVRQQQALIFAQTVAESALAVARAASTGSGVLSPILVASTIAALVSGFIAARAATQSAIGGFAEGGWTGKGGKYEPAGVVHREEFVVKKGPAERWRPMLEQINKGRDPYLAAGMGQQVIMINNVGVEERLSRIEKAITGQDRMQLTIDESGIHGIVSHYQFKNQRIRNRAK